MAFGEEEVAVFAETNLETRIVMTVPLDITAADFKRKLEKTHTSCFSSLGEIRVHGLMVKRRSSFYYLAESVPIKYIFKDNKKPWFIHAEARVINGSQESSISNSIVDQAQSRFCAASDYDKGVFCCPSTSEPETTRSSLSIARAAECFLPQTPERKHGDSVSTSDMISKKLSVAANNIRMKGKTHVSSSLSTSIFRSKSCGKRSLDGKALTSLAKFLVFEIPDTED